MSLLENKPSALTASMYSTHIGNNTPTIPVNDNNKANYNKPVSNQQHVEYNPSQDKQQYRGRNFRYKNGR